jgi:outer membrane protein OmpA-like peptidoglycan-associated protein
MAAPAKFVADTLTDLINSTASNFNPLITPDENALFYTNQLKFYDAIMFTEKDDSGWISPENLTPLIKSDGDHYTTGITADGKQLFLTSYDPYLTGEIFSTSHINGEWSEMQKLNDNINTRFNETHASVTPDGNILYFTSDRKGGYGGLDIYRSAKNENGVWQQPVNLGPLINTPFNEETPFVSSDGKKLFFSSQGHYNMGGYDVFCSATDNDGNWLPPVNIGYPLNSTDDDLFYFPLDTGGIGYQSRFSNPSVQKDIVRYKVISFGKPARFIVNGNIELLADSGFNAASVQVTFIDRHGNDTLDMKALNDDGTFRQKLPSGSYSLNFSTAQKSLLTRNLEIPDYLPYNNLVLNEKIEVVSAIIADTFYLNDIRFDFNTSNINEVFLGKLKEIANLMIRYPEITVQVDGYADSRGHSAYNLKLSLNRANHILDFLTQKLGSSSRISINALGENHPLAVNTNENGSDNAEGRRYNRRAEISIHNAPSSLVVIKVNDVPLNLLLKK